MTSIIIYYGYTYFGLPDIDEKKEGYFYSYAKVDDSDEKIDTAYNQVIEELKNMERTKLWPASKLAQLYFFDDKMTLEKLSAEIKICKSTSFTQIKRAKKHLSETIDNPFKN